MSTVIENLIERVAALPKDARDEAVRSLLAIEARHLGVYRLSDDERADILDVLDEVARGIVASDEEARALFARLRG